MRRGITRDEWRGKRPSHRTSWSFHSAKYLVCKFVDLFIQWIQSIFIISFNWIWCGNLDVAFRSDSGVPRDKPERWDVGPISQGSICGYKTGSGLKAWYTPMKYSNIIIQIKKDCERSVKYLQNYHPCWLWLAPWHSPFTVFTGYRTLQVHVSNNAPPTFLCSESRFFTQQNTKIPRVCFPLHSCRSWSCNSGSLDAQHRKCMMLGHNLGWASSTLFARKVMYDI